MGYAAECLQVFLRLLLDHVDNVIDRASGTIRGRAQFANPNGLFTPGMFARVQIPGSAPYEALLLPDAAIGTEQARKFVLVVGADNAVAQKYVTLGELVGCRFAGHANISRWLGNMKKRPSWGKVNEAFDNLAGSLKDKPFVSV